MLQHMDRTVGVELDAVHQSVEKRPTLLMVFADEITYHIHRGADSNRKPIRLRLEAERNVSRIFRALMLGQMRGQLEDLGERDSELHDFVVGEIKRSGNDAHCRADNIEVLQFQGQAKLYDVLRRIRCHKSPQLGGHPLPISRCTPPLRETFLNPPYPSLNLPTGSLDGIILPEPKPFIGIHMEDEWHSKRYTTQVAIGVTDVTAG